MAKQKADAKPKSGEASKKKDPKPKEKEKQATPKTEKPFSGINGHQD